MTNPLAPRRMIALVLSCWNLSVAAQSTVITNAPASNNVDPAVVSDPMVLPPSVPDPIEPVNRAIWGFNRGVMTWVVKPTGKVYRTVVRKPIRTAISNLGYHVKYPGRLVNNLLQGRWHGARDETYRFFCNTLVGGGGLFDVASECRIAKSQADFGQTFGRWGWRPGVFLMLPFYGPSNERDALGLVCDSAADPLQYVTPNPEGADGKSPLFSPYTYFNFGVTYNNLTDSVENYVRFAKSESDSYALLRYAWTFARSTRSPDLQLHGETEASSLDTLLSTQVRFSDSRFPDRAFTKSVKIRTTGRNLKFSLWLQSKPAPVVYLVPGLGSHRLTDMTLSVAELIYQSGRSVVCVSSPYNPEFMSQASTAAVPGYTPTDARDLHEALTDIDGYLVQRYPGRLGNRALVGYSMGGFHTLFLAAAEPAAAKTLLHFDRFVAVNPPVRLSYGISRLDAFYRAPLAWPATERQANMENTLLKLAATTSGSLVTTSTVPYSAIESQFLIGLSFRLKLRDVIYHSQRRTDLGVLKNPLRKSRREAIYGEIEHYSFAEYLQQFAVRYYESQGVHLSAPGILDQAGDLRTYAEGLRDNHKVWVVTNENDFLLAAEDLGWLRASLPAEHVTTFKRGGHMGNLGSAEVRQAILQALTGL